MDKIPFNRAAIVGNELQYIGEAILYGDISGDRAFTKKSERLLEQQLANNSRVLLTTSCTHALEMAAILLNLEPGDEVIVPSYTFVSTALAFHMQGARIVFADIRADTLNLDEKQLENLITERTRAIVVVHYAGVACEMDEILSIAAQHNIVLVEDNAHGLYGKYKGRYLGTIGQLATQSFHGTKNITCGEGGALIVNEPDLIERAEIIREKGTNRAKFFRGQVDKYSWVDKGSSYVMSDILAAFLFGQLEKSEFIQAQRKKTWDFYRVELSSWADINEVQLPIIPDYCEQTYHMFYLMMPNLEARSHFIEHCRKNSVTSVFHYLPLHSSVMGREIAPSQTPLNVSDDVSERLVRLPLYPNLSCEEQEKIVRVSKQFCSHL